METRTNVLILCTHNSARSQMAERLRHLAGERFSVYSAGLEPGTVHPLAKQVIEELGISMAGQYSKSVKEYLGKLYVQHLIIVCGSAAQQCPSVWPGVRHRLIWPFDDPSNVQGTEAQRLAAFRQVRDQIKDKFTAWLAEESAK